MRRRLILGVTSVATTTGLVLTGCSSGTNAASQSEDSLVWSMWISGAEDKAAWQEVADAVSENGGPEVTIQGSPWTDYWTKLRTQLSAGGAPCIVSVQSLRAANYTDVLVPLDSLAEEAGVDLAEFDATALDGMKVDGELYALPYDTGPVVMFYNEDLFDEVGAEIPGPGWTMDEFEAAAARFEEAGTPLLASTVEDMFLESLILGHNGGRVIDEDGTLDATDPTFSEGLDWIASLVESGQATQASAEGTADDNAYVNQQAGMYVDGPWSLLAQKARVDFTLGVTTIPAGASGPSTFSAGSGFGISQECEHPDRAFEAIRTMTSEPVLRSLAEQGRAFPARTAVQQVWYDSAGIEGAQEVLTAAQEASVPLPGNRQSDQLAQLLTQYAVQAVNGQQSGADTMESIAGQLEQ
ncbi:ABC transporter substrate-binding protein [Streptomyces radicis]|uniref:Sugar ABC transporter substrate-binding protein n=1 Tax=Streptomyces radicis TaxID=1750517 RepID=A0A3A9WSH5_9ACTN|nr:sugar ABC transporter substrate-binding protein [Streptomyces radicis]RKN12504.1 sugar ABC transporter substrate-binding protein [Streptomyces radicis]RKN27728.1 sugar ABC transporter substrate-binding protein [Streptomyces radicis]